MDILISSNLERLIFEVSGRDCALTEKRMADLKKTGKYVITDAEKKLIEKSFYADYCDEEDCAGVIAGFFDEYGYVLDPHTAVAIAVEDGYRSYTGDELNTVVLSTASAYKFSQNVLKSITGKAPEDAFKAANMLNQETAAPIPEQIVALKTKERRFNKVIDRTETVSAVMEFIEK